MLRPSFNHLLIYRPTHAIASVFEECCKAHGTRFISVCPVSLQYYYVGGGQDCSSSHLLLNSAREEYLPTALSLVNIVLYLCVSTVNPKVVQGQFNVEAFPKSHFGEQ